MDESALRIFVASLEASRSTLHWWLEFWTFLVVAGVALEVVFVVWEYVEELHDFNRGIIHPPERPGRLLFALGLLGAALVASGVAGELYAESKIETVETRIRKANDELFSLLSTEASNAAASAKTAHDEADTVKKEADAIRSQIQPRSYTPAEVEAIDKSCKPYAGTAVRLRSQPYDVEGAIFGTYLGQTLRGEKCHLIVDTSGVGNNFIQNLPMFMDVHVTGPPESKAFIDSLARALTTPRVKAMADMGRPGIPIDILVGAKRLSAPE